MRSGITPTGIKTGLHQAGQALKAWTTRQWAAAAAASLGFGLLVGFATVLIPNSVFARDIAPVWWNYPVWLATSLASGMLIATYVRPSAESSQEQDQPQETNSERRSGRMGMVGGALAWFAVGCPVCNKIALLALGYSGAITWFAPVQPFLALAAMILTGAALIWRLRGQMACPLPSPSDAPTTSLEPVK